MATPVKWETEFTINAVTLNTQNEPFLAALPDGRFAAAWTDFNFDLPDNRSAGITSRIFNANGTAGTGDIGVNTTVPGIQFNAQIASLGDGRYVVLWTDRPSGASGIDDDVRGQIINSDGTFDGPEFLVNEATARPQLMPVVAAFKDGSFVAAWQDWSTFGLSHVSINYRLFNPDGTPKTGEFEVDLPIDYFQQSEPSIIILAGGKFMLTWHDGTGFQGSNVVRQIFNADGSRDGDASVLIETSVLYSEVVTGLPGGDFLVTWAQGPDSATSDIHAQFFNANGTKRGTELTINTSLTADQSNPSVTLLNDGRLLVAWQDGSQNGQGTIGYDIRAQVINVDGTFSGSEFVVNSTVTKDQTSPFVSTLVDGRVVVSWADSATNSGDVKAQIIDPREASISLAGTRFDDQNVGTVFADLLKGAGGNDSLEGAAGNDTLSGAIGNDSMFGGDDNDSISGGAGSDVLQGGAGADSLSGGTGSDRMFGNDGNDSLMAEDGNDILAGGVGKDTLLGGGGRDRLDGGFGADDLTGGSGADRFVFRTAAETGSGAFRDHITDFQTGLDRLDFSAFMGGATFIGEAVFTNTTHPQVRFIAATGILLGDVDGNGKVDFSMKIDASAPLTESDFIF